MRTFEYVCSEFDHPVNNMCFYFAKTEIRLDFKCVFLYM